MTSPTPPFILIDGHQDLAYNALAFGRDLLLPAVEKRRLEAGSLTEQRNGGANLGWPDYQRGQIALIIATLYISARLSPDDWDTQTYRSRAEAARLWEKQVEYYYRLTGEHPDKFRLVRERRELQEVLAPWRAKPARFDVAGEDELPVTHPVGLVLLMENAEGLGEPAEMERWYERGVRLVGPVWAANETRFCGGTRTDEGFTREGYALLDVMAGLGMTLDIAHMNERSALQALDRYEGAVVATHANCRALLREPETFRHLTDTVIRRLVERGGVMGVIPLSTWLRPGWSAEDPREATTLAHMANHIDHICQLAGDAGHAALGTDLDGGWGWPTTPVELETIADLPRLAQVLQDRGYEQAQIAAILGGNWSRFLERSLP